MGAAEIINSQKTAEREVMASKKIETKKLRKLVGVTNLVEIKKGIGGKVFTQLITNIQKSGPTPKGETYVAYTDHTDHSNYSVHSEHRETIHEHTMAGKAPSKKRPKVSKPKRTPKK